MNTTPTKDNIIGIRTEMQHKSLVQCDDDDADYTGLFVTIFLVS